MGAAESRSAWEALRADAIRPSPAGDDQQLHGNELQGDVLRGNGLDAPSGFTGAVVAVVSRCALGDWAGAERVIVELLDGGAWQPLAEAELGVRELARLPGADAERLAAIRDGLIRRMAAVAARPD